MKKALLSLVLLAGLTLSLNGHFTWNNIARAQATAVPSCQFAGYNPNGSLINTTIVCVSPVASGGAVTTVGATATACGAAVAPSPTGGAVVVQVPVCPTASAGPGLPLSVDNGGTGVSSPNPTGTNGCTVGSFPSLVVSCPTSAPITLPLSVANGGTGTAAPAPTSSNGCTVTGTWPSQTFSCPTAAAGTASVIYAAGVPSSAPAQAGQLDVATDTTYPGMKLFSYNGSYTGLPVVVNRGVFVNPSTSPTSSPVVQMERTVVAGQLVMAMLTSQGGGFTYESPNPTWTPIFKNEASSVGIALAEKISAGGETTETPYSLSQSAGQVIVVVAIVNAAASPLPTSTVLGTSGTATMTGIAINSLLLSFGGCPTNALPGVQTANGNAGSYNIYVTNSGGSAGQTSFFSAFPFITPYVGNAVAWTQESCSAAAIVQISPSATAFNYWDVIK